MNTLNVVQRENARLKSENDALREEVTNLRDLVQILSDLNGRTIASDAELLPLLRDILRKSLRLLNTPEGSLLMLDDETNELVFLITQGTLGRDLEGYRISATEGIAGWVVKHGKAVLVPDVRTDIRFSHTVDQAFKFKTQSIAAAPLLGSHKVYGVVEALNKPGDKPFNQQDLELLSLVCSCAGQVLAEIDRQKVV